MAVVKGGVWHVFQEHPCPELKLTYPRSNIEDEILKASVSKYGLQQWARVSSLLARKTPKQCKARWAEWLDPGVRKIEWSKEDDEKLLHLAKLMPTQWRTIAPIVGRTANQCLERYQKLLDEAEARENDEMGLRGPDGGETAAPSADDVRRLRPGELDPDPESKPARPDTVDMDEDEKEMLSEARARLANTQGKKAKRKARERQLEESRRLAVLQKRRELKNAGINIKVITRKPGQMDYNADIPFEKAPAPGFYDTQEEEVRNERQREMFDPRKQQLANKRKGDPPDDGDDHKRRKNEKVGQSAASAAAAKAGQMQKYREAERSSKRRALNLPAPQVNENEIEDMVKMGMAGERATQRADVSDNEATRGLLGSYTGIAGSTPIRTPRAPQEEDRVANEIRNARARTATQSALLGGENAELYEGEGTTGYEGVAPSKQQASTPNPMATPYRQGGTNGVGGTPRGVGATPMRTPRDNFGLNHQTLRNGAGQTPREIKLHENAMKNSLRGKLAALPKPKETEWELELPDEQQEASAAAELGEEDAAIRDQRNLEIRLAAERMDFRRQTQVVQKRLPRPEVVDLDHMLKTADNIEGAAEMALAMEAALLIAHDAAKFPLNGTKGKSSTLETFADGELERARMEIVLEVQSKPTDISDEDFENAWMALQDEVDVSEGYLKNVQGRLESLATSANATEKKLALHLGGYQQRSKLLRQKCVDAAEALEKSTIELDTKTNALVGEEAAIGSRLKGLRAEVQTVTMREREAQERYAN